MATTKPTLAASVTNPGSVLCDIVKVLSALVLGRIKRLPKSIPPLRMASSSPGSTCWIKKRTRSKSTHFKTKSNPLRNLEKKFFWVPTSYSWPTTSTGIPWMWDI
ncbi:uncharacterized protein HMPREF1120_03102 [Exophiala dermatitidis NIH/UT8656]|uniref:Uncharacterized protein n=1 Tax=Exophiala dermatitidis (strain ATCC 34100 / CBS 525.76 / NIH/UT8656) TaxID=858893 RepID=H6BUX3_EXODN|nr:uncharacterized protein HMPREF1120_03102 [Exophiala dermatitidis NIH/UT8656]EHY54943.1 hypothetical protein HMPREF1120_03102 [Exophiala dermatitidis NIH/UT8656]